MGTPTNYIVFNGSGAVTGSGYTPDGTLPAGAVACTASQFQTARQATLVAGAIVMGEAPVASAAQIAAAAYGAFISGGLTVTSTATPALSGVYAIDPASLADIAAEAQFISTFAEFTNGTTANLQWSLSNGSLVTFATTAEFLAFAKAIGQQVATAKLALMQSAAMPPATATIP